MISIFYPKDRDLGTTLIYRYRISVLCNEDGRVSVKLVKVRDAGVRHGEHALRPVAVREWETTCGAGTAFAAKIFQGGGSSAAAVVP